MADSSTHSQEGFGLFLLRLSNRVRQHPGRAKIRLLTPEQSHWGRSLQTRFLGKDKGL